MPQAAYPYYYEHEQVPMQKPEAPQEEEVANFLLALKHRSVTPEPPAVGDYRSYKSHYHSQHTHYSPYAYDVPQQAYMEQPPPQPAFNTSNVNWEELLSDSELVHLKDRDLVPDALFLAMAQMKACTLTLADRVGCYKNREIGFVGMCCKHCGGQPGFGRYYPNSVRSLAQTTTSQTILKHIGSKCRYCPTHVRSAVNEFQRLQTLREGSGPGRPRYGSRKIFFQRVWSRLHGGAKEVYDDEASLVTHKTLDDLSSLQTPSDLDEECSNSLATSNSGDQSLESENGRKRDHFGSFPAGKRVKVTSPHHRLTAD